MATARTERRLAAILAADVVGYSALMGRDEAGTLDRLKAVRKELVEPLIAEHRGRIVKLMGDGALCEFPSVVDAVACAVAIQRGMAGREPDLPEADRIRFRIGVNLGDVIVEGEDIYGDGVNIAARLEGLAESGGICVSGKVREEMRRRLEFVFAPMGQQRVKNIAEPIEAWRVVLDGRAGRPQGIRRPRRVRAAFAAALALLLVSAAAVGAWWWHRAAGPIGGLSSSDRPSIAVLPFDNLSGDPVQDYFSDGLSEDLTTDLSKLRGLFVIARNSAFAYKGKAVDVRRIGEELGVRYVLEGSARKAGDRVRINAQLVDTTTGDHLWAERFDRPADDILALQDEVVRKIVANLDVRLVEGEQAAVWRRTASDPRAYDLFMRGRQLKLQEGREAAHETIRLLEEAVRLDPGFAQAWVTLGWGYWSLVYSGWTDAPEEAKRKALDAAQHAITADALLGDPHALLADIAVSEGDNARALREAELAAKDSPNSADNLAMLAAMLADTPRSGEMLEVIRRAMRLNPIPPAWYYNVLGQAYLGEARHDEAVAAFLICIEKAPDFITCHRYLIAAYLEAGRLDEARVEARQVLRINPTYSIAKDETWVKSVESAAERQRRTELLRKVGLPE